MQGGRVDRDGEPELRIFVKRREICVAFGPAVGYPFCFLASSGAGRGVSDPLLASPGIYGSARNSREFTIDKRAGTGRE